MSSASHPRAVPLRPILLPAEHGGWGFLLEPILLALLIAPSWSGALLGAAALGVFLTRHPLRLALTDRRRGRRYPRTVVAERAAAAYFVPAFVCGAAAVLLAVGGWWWPLLVAAPLALVQLAFDARHQGRELLPELAGALALAASAPMIALAAGTPDALAIALWVVLAGRVLTSIPYVRARLRLERGAAVNSAPVLVAHTAALLVVMSLAALGVLPWLTALVFAALLARAAHGLSARRGPAKAMVIGLREMLFGIALVLLTALGYSSW